MFSSWKFIYGLNTSKLGQINYSAFDAYFSSCGYYAQNGYKVLNCFKYYKNKLRSISLNILLKLSLGKKYF